MNIRKKHIKKAHRETEFEIEVIKDILTGDLLYLNEKGVPVKISGGSTSSAISYDPTASGLTATDVQAAIDELAASTPTDTNSWSINTAAFVSKNTGNDSTAVLGDGNKPYLTIGAASTASTLVIILPGTYTETVTLKTLTTYYCYPGVKFTSGGLRTSATPIVDTRWLGYAEFNGNFQQIYLQNTTATNLKLEWDRSVETGSTARAFHIEAVGGVTFEATCRNITIYGGGGYGARMQQTISGVLNIKEFIKGSYGVILFGGGGIELVGKVTINCPRIICADGGFVGNNAAFKQAVISNGIAVGSIITINGDIYDEVVVPLGSVSGCISSNGGPGGTIIHNGNIYGLNLRGIYNAGLASIIQNGNVNTVESPYFGTNGMTLIKNSKIVTTKPIVLSNANPTLYMKDCSYYNSAAGNAIDHTSASNKLYIENSTFEVQVGSECINTGGAASSAGLINVTATVANDGALLSNYTASGFTVEANLNVPKF